MITYKLGAVESRAPKWITCLLWTLVAVRLVYPVPVKSTLSLVAGSGDLLEAAGSRKKPADRQDSGRLPEKGVAERSAYEKEELLQDMLEAWYRAFTDRDAETITAMASAELCMDFRDRGIFTGQEGAYRFKIRDTWPQDDSTDCHIQDYNDRRAEILYYAGSSEPHVTAWRETLYYQWDGSRYVVTGERLDCYDRIASGKEYYEAYPYALDGSNMDYTRNGLGRALQDQALYSGSRIYRPLFSPESAAVRLLNLSAQDVVVSRKGEATARMAGLELTFLKDQLTVTISMVRPYGEYGIWVPADYHIDVVHRFMDADWDKVSKLHKPERGVMDDTKNILCIGELPEYGIKVYGYNDKEVCGAGVAVEKDGNINYFDWPYISPRGILPDLYWDEAHRQLQISFYVYTGTGASADSLYVLQYGDHGEAVPYNFDLDGYSREIKKRTGHTFDKKSRTLTLMDLKTGRELASVKLPEGEFTGMEYGMISDFQLGDTITCQVTPGFYLDGSAMAQYDDMMELEFDVELKLHEDGNGTFSLGDAHVPR